MSKKCAFFIIKKVTCGVERIYPLNDRAKKMAGILKKKTFSTEEIKNLHDLNCFEIVEFDKDQNIIVTETIIKPKNASESDIFD